MAQPLPDFNLNSWEDFPPLFPEQPVVIYNMAHPPQPAVPPAPIEETETVEPTSAELPPPPALNKCVVCQCSFAEADGLHCCEPSPAAGERHFTCQGCLTNMVESYCAMDDDSGVIGKISFDNIHQLIKCPGYDLNYELCEHRFKNAKAAKVISEHAFDVMQSAIFKLTERHIMRDFDNVLKARLKLEIDKYMNTDEHTRILEQHRTHILENCLNLACPRCKAVFVEFDGCYAIECSTCGCGFCAYCLEDCGDDAHDHVMSCELNPAQHSDYGDSGDGNFEAIQNTRRTKMILEYLQEHVLATDMRTKLVSDLEVQFRELGMDTNAIALNLATPG